MLVDYKDKLEFVWITLWFDKELTTQLYYHRQDKVDEEPCNRIITA